MEPLPVRPSHIDVSIMYQQAGKALCMIQFLEDALCHSIALKKNIKLPNRISRQEADQFLAKYRKLPLGPAIKNANDSRAYNVNLIDELNSFLPERNWLVHHGLIQVADSLHISTEKHIFFARIESIAVKAKALQKAIEADLMDYSKKNGVDMSRVEKAIAQHEAAS